MIVVVVSGDHGDIIIGKAALEFFQVDNHFTFVEMNSKIESNENILEINIFNVND